MSRRSQILDALATKLALMDGVNYTSNIFNNISKKMLFPDALPDYPYLCMSAGTEKREYLPANFKWGWLSIVIRVYVQEEETLPALEPFLEDIEAILDANNELEYATDSYVREIMIDQISTDEGLLAPLGIGEIKILVRYDL